MSSSLAANRLGFRPCANHSVGRRSPPAAVRLPAPCRRPRCRASASAAPAVEPAAPEAAAAAAAPAGELPHHRGYPHIDQRFPGLELVHAEPPVYLAHDFLSAEDCALLRSSAAAGELPSVEYENRVLADTNRLWPLALVVAAGAGFDCWQALACAAGVAGSSSIGSIAAVAGPSLLRWAAGVGGLLAAVLLGMQQLAGGSVFTGTKWTAAGLPPDHRTAPALSRFLARTCALLGTQPGQLEPATVTRYLPGQHQRAHFDARPHGDPAGLQQFLEAGGQRLVQVLVYLNTLGEEQGGGTHFCHPLLQGLTVQPRQGDALIFFPAFADGCFDGRMAHSGQAVLAGQKWTVNTWACQRRVPIALAQLPAVHRQLERLARQQ